LSDAFTATVGLRQFSEDVSQSDTDFPGGVAAPPSLADSSSDKTVPKFSLAYTGIENVLVYGSASQGFRVGGVNIIPIPGTGAPDSFKSDELWAYELGAKFSVIDNRLSGSVAVFRIDWDDIQLFTPDFGFAVVTNGGRATITGIETELSFRVSDSLLVGLNGSLMKAENAETNASLGIVDGTRLRRTPEGSAALFVNYRRPVNFGSGEWDFGVTADASFVGDQTNSNPTAPLFKEEFHTVNARMTLTSESWEFAVYGRNLNNDKTLTFFSATDAGVPRPRTVGIEIISRF
jgi:outer membrane receptor protein involved in Fe transport